MASPKFEVVLFEKMNPAAYNPRKDLKPDDPEYQKLKRSIDKFDCVEPIVWNQQTGNIVGGHQRFKILKDRGDTEAMTSIVDMSLEDEKLLNIALNKISGEWDFPKLADLFVGLDELNVDLSLSGFDADEIDLIAPATFEPTEDEPEPSGKPKMVKCPECGKEFDIN